MTGGSAAPLHCFLVLLSPGTCNFLDIILDTCFHQFLWFLQTFFKLALLILSRFCSVWKNSDLATITKISVAQVAEQCKYGLELLNTIYNLEI